MLERERLAIPLGDSARPGAFAPGADDSSTAQRVLLAAYACFERESVAKTTIEEIAQAAGVSRPTVYKHYPGGKEALLDEISRREVLRINAEVRTKLVRGRPFAEFLSDVLLIVIRTAARSVYVRRTIEHHDYQRTAFDENGAMAQLQRDWWAPMLRHAAERGDLATDITIDESVAWLSHSQAMLLQWVEDPMLDDAGLRRLIDRFVIAPLLKINGSAII